MTGNFDDDLLTKAPVGELLGLYSRLLLELRERGVLRTNNPPSGDYAEWLVAGSLRRSSGAELEPLL